MPFIKIIPEHEFSAIEEEWRQVQVTPWSFILPEGSDIMESDVRFWLYVKEYKEGDFKRVANFALGCLSIAHSTAAVERLFSQVKIVKSELRNRLSIETLDSVLRIRTFFSARKICCHNFSPTKDFLDKFSSEIYFVKKDDEMESVNQILNILPSTSH